MLGNNSKEIDLSKKRSIKRDISYSTCGQIDLLKKLIVYLKENLCHVEMELDNCQKTTTEFEDFIQHESMDKIVKQTNKNNDFSGEQKADIDDISSLTKNKDDCMKKHIDKIIASNKDLHNIVNQFKDDQDKKSKLLREKIEQCNKLNEDMKELKKHIKMQEKEIHFLKTHHKNDTKTFQSKIKLLEKEDLMNKQCIDEMDKKLKLKECETKQNNASLEEHKSKQKELEAQIQLMDDKADTIINCYKEKVRKIIEELKSQMRKVSYEIKEVHAENGKLKMELSTTMATQSNLSQTVEDKQNQIDKLKEQLAQECEKTENLNKQLSKWNIQYCDQAAKVKKIKLDRDRYYKMSINQDNAIQNLLKEIKHLSYQLKGMKMESGMDLTEEESYYMHDSTEAPEDFDQDDENRDLCNSNNCNYTNTASNYNNIEGSDFESYTDENMNKKLQDNLQALQYTDSDGNSAIEQFSKYLEEQLKLIKIANENSE